MSRAEFLATVAPVAIKVRVDGGVLFPSVSIAQMLLETGGTLHSWNNLVGYKVGSGQHTPYWHGKRVNRKTWEVDEGGRRDNVAADFRAYDSIEDNLKDQALLFLNNRRRYQRVIDARTPEEQAAMLLASGYATDPQYGEKIIAIIRSHGLTQYDREADQMLERIADLERNHKQLQQRLEQMERQHKMAVPDWAKDAVEAAVQAGYIDTPEGGSLDFYRLVVVMYRAGMFSK